MNENITMGVTRWSYRLGEKDLACPDTDNIMLSLPNGFTLEIRPTNEGDGFDLNTQMGCMRIAPRSGNSVRIFREPD